MKTVRRFEGPTDPPVRLDLWLRQVLPELSRSRLQEGIEAGEIRVGGHTVKASYRLRPGDEVTADLAPPAAVELGREAIALDILHEDNDLVVVNKPAGMVVHPGAGVACGTLVNALLHRYGSLSPLGAPVRPGIVHRLDKGTSGVIVVARTEVAHRSLAAQFERREVQKDYLAIVWGCIRPRGVLDAAVGRHPRKRKTMTVLRGGRGRMAVTSWERLGSAERASLVQLHPHTGRTHQLRVHLAYLGYPIVGDPEYGARAAQGHRQGLEPGHLAREATRPMLHAHRITFLHPARRAFVTFKAPVPDDFRRVLGALGLTLPA